MKKINYSIQVFICLLMLISNACFVYAQKIAPGENRGLIISACTKVNDILTYIYEPSTKAEAKKKYSDFIKEFVDLKTAIESEKLIAPDGDYKDFTMLLILLTDNALEVAENRLKRLDIKDGTKKADEIDEENKNLVFEMVRKIWDTEPYLKQRDMSYKGIFKFFSR